MQKIMTGIIISASDVVDMNLCLIDRLAFRTLVRKYNCDIAYSPMIISSSFVQSAKARDNEFSTNSGINGLFLKL
jgi:tRNA-dihydrouridine synthase